MARGRLRLIGFVRKPRNPTEQGIGQALRDAYTLDDAGDSHEVRRMEELIEKLKQIEGEEICQG